MQLEEQKSYLVISNLTLYLGYLISYVFLLYFTFKLFRVDYFNPIVVNFVKVFNFLGLPSNLVTVFMMATAAKYATFYSLLDNKYEYIDLAIISILHTAASLTRMILYIIIGSVILSWVAPQNNRPIFLLLNEISNKCLDPIRRFIPSIGGLDISPIFAFILINQIEILLNSVLRSFL